MKLFITYAWQVGRRTILVIAFVGMLAGMAVGPVWAQSSVRSPATAEEYFHEAAQQYIEKEVQQALATVEQGLQQAPQHPKLLALREKLKQEGGQQAAGDQQQSGQQQSPSSSQQGDQENDQQSSENEQGNQNPDDNESGDPSQQPNEEPPDEGQPNQNQRPQDGSNAGSGNAGDQQPSEGAQQRAQAAGALSRAQAERILEALEGQEKQLLREVQKRDARPYPVEKDW